MKEINTKKCNNCNKFKYFDEFHKSLTNKFGLGHNCKICDRNIRRIRRQKNKEKVNAANNLYRQKNPEKRRIGDKSYRIKNKSKTSIAIQKWAKENPGKRAFYCAKRRAQKGNATPPWLSKDQFKEIEQYYRLAKELQWLSEDILEVDHIIPLLGKNVSGLHVPWNLQILPKSLNASKSNKA